uniref:Major sperm protein n=1 Tax=Heligmosomoides polygyrus TaxID=6339 RepID=A0A8L8K461_HELPZ
LSRSTNPQPVKDNPLQHSVGHNSDQWMMFKVKLSNTDDYRVSPVFGFVDASSNANIEVIRKSGAPRNDRMVVQLVPAPQDATDARAAFGHVQNPGVMAHNGFIQKMFQLGQQALWGHVLKWTVDLCLRPVVTGQPDPRLKPEDLQQFIEDLSTYRTNRTTPWNAWSTFILSFAEHSTYGMLRDRASSSASLRDT